MEKEKDEELFEISKIISKRTINDFTEILVEWAETGEKSWIPIQNIKNYKEVLMDYELEKYEKLADSGQIEYDYPKDILLLVELQSGAKKALVSWKKRKNGFLPKKSFVLFKDMENLHDIIVLKYYTSHIIFELTDPNKEPDSNEK